MTRCISREKLPEHLAAELKAMRGQWVKPSDLTKKYNLYAHDIGTILSRLIREGQPIEREEHHAGYWYRWTGEVDA